MKISSRCVSVLAPAVLLAIAPMLSRAQDAPATRPAGNGGEVVVSQATTRGGPTTQISLNFENATIDAVLDQLSKAAGFKILKETTTAGRISLMSHRPLPPDEAIALFNSSLQQHGYVVLKQGDTLKLTTKDKAKTGATPVYFGANPDEIPENDDIRTQVVPIKSVDAVKLKTDLQPLVGTDTVISSNAGSNSILITDTAAKVKRVVKIISSMDQRDALENTIFVKQLKYADASAAARLVTDIFKAEETNNQPNVQGPGAFFRAMQQGGGGGRGGGGGGQQQQEDAGRMGKVVASADTRTNTVVVSGPAATLEVIKTMLEQLDANPTTEAAFFLYPLKNGQSANMAAVLNSLFGVGGSTGTAGRTTGTTTGGRTTTTGGGTQRTQTFGGASTGGGGGGLSGTSTLQSTGMIQRTSPGATTGFPNVSSAVAGAASQLAGQVYVVPDADTNSLLISTASKYKEQVEQIIEQLDRPVPQVLMKVLIAEVTHNNTSDFGVDFSILNTRASGLGQTVGTTFPPVPSGGLVVSVLEEHVQATIRALATAGKLDILSRPYVLASDNQLATIMVGQQVPYITDTRITDSGQQINSIDYEDIGIILNVTPHINPDGLVIVDVAPVISSISDLSIPISSTVNATVFNKRSADTRVGIKNGETIVIGGLMQDQKTETISKVPILGDIPVLRLLLRRKVQNKTKTELLIFLTPHVAATPNLLKGQSQDEMKGTRLVPNAVQPGTFQEHLRGMQRGATTQPSSLTAPPKPEGRRGPIPETPLPGTERNAR